MLPGRGRTAGLCHIEGDYSCDPQIKIFSRNLRAVISHTQFVDDAIELVRKLERELQSARQTSAQS